MNDENLKPVRSEREAREKGKKGGIKSGEKRRERRQLKEELILLLEYKDTQKKITTALINKALKGDIKAFEVIRDTIGEKRKAIESRDKDYELPKIVIRCGDDERGFHI